MAKPAFYLAVVVLLQTASGLEWEFGTNLSGSKTIMEKEGIIPYYLHEKRVQISKAKCTDVIYVKVEIEDMPAVTYNIDVGMVIIKFEKRRRAKNSEFRVTAKGVKSESGKCGGPTPRATTGYTKSQHPYDATPYLQFSNEYFPEDGASNNGFKNDAPLNNAFPDDAPPNNALPNDAPLNNAFPDDAPPNNVFSNDAPPNNAFPNDAPPNNAFPNDAPPNNAFPNDAPPNNAFPNDAPPNNAFPNDAPPNNAFPNDAPPNNVFPHDAPPYNAHQDEWLDYLD